MHLTVLCVKDARRQLKEQVEGTDGKKESTVDDDSIVPAVASPPASSFAAPPSVDTCAAFFWDGTFPPDATSALVYAEVMRCLRALLLVSHMGQTVSKNSHFFSEPGTVGNASFLGSMYRQQPRKQYRPIGIHGDGRFSRRVMQALVEDCVHLQPVLVSCLC